MLYINFYLLLFYQKKDKIFFLTQILNFYLLLFRIVIFCTFFRQNIA